MELRFEIQQTGADKRETIVAGLADVVAWEERFERPSSELGGDRVFARDFVWLAWHAQTRRKKTTLEFTEWVELLEDIEASESPALVPLENTPATGW